MPNKPIRVAQIVGKLWSGGVEMVVFNYYRAIDKEKIQFDFFYDADSTATPPRELIDMGARFYEIPPYQYLSAYLKTLIKYFKANNYNIVHSHINTLNVFPLFAAWLCGVPVRIAHNHSVPGGNEAKRNALKYFLRTFAKVFPTDYFACSEKAGRWMFGDKSFDDGKVTIIKNATDFSRFKQDSNEIRALKEALGLTNKFVVGHIGRFTFAKNHKFLLDIFKEISAVRDDAVLLLVGDGELHEKICAWIREDGLTSKVVFAGQVSDPERYYRLADVIVLPSFFEGLSLTTVESQLAGIPVVVSDSIPEEAIISDGVARLSLNSSNWADTVLAMADKTVTLNQKCQEYNIEVAVKKLEEWYEKRMNS